MSGFFSFYNKTVIIFISGICPFFLLSLLFMSALFVFWYYSCNTPFCEYCPQIGPVHPDSPGSAGAQPVWRDGDPCG